MAKPNSGIYRVSLGNDYFYIGSAKNLSKRRLKHLSDLRLHRHANQVIRRCWAKYGVFEFEVLEFCPVDQMLIKEQALLDIHFGDPKCTNICPTAKNMSGFKHSLASRKVMSDKHLGVSPSKATREKQSEIMKNSPSAVAHIKRLNGDRIGVPLSETHREAISAGKMGHPVSEATKEKLSISVSAYWAKRRETVIA